MENLFTPLKINSASPNLKNVYHAVAQVVRRQNFMEGWIRVEHQW